MATKAKPKKTMKKQHTPDYYQVMRNIPIGVNGASLTGIVQSDAGRLLSQANRRLYRYGYNYQIKLDLDPGLNLDTDVRVEVYTLRNTWDVQRAYALAKKVYDDAYAEEREISSQMGRWRDFRVSHGVTGAVTGQPVITDNASLAQSVITDGEFTLSQVDKGGVDTHFTWGVAASNSIDIVNEWIQSGRTSSDPSTSSTVVPYDGVNSDELSDIEMTNLGSNGNDPPYGADSDSDMLVKVSTLRFNPALNGIQKLSTGFIDAPCGLFILKFNGNVQNGTVHFTAKAGDYKGVAAHKMCQ